MSFFFCEDPFFEMRRQSRMMDRLFRGFSFDPEAELLSLPEPEHESEPTSTHQQGKNEEKSLKRRERDKGQMEVFSWRPRSDIKETETSIIVTAELPGVPKENINIKIEDDVLTIEGKKETSKETSSEDKPKETKETEGTEKTEKEGKDQKDNTKKVQWHRVERSFGSFRRSYALPSGTTSSDIKAHYEDGVLKIDIAKKQKEDRAIKIPVM